MAEGKKVVDKYANFAAVLCAETAANGGAFVKFAFPFSIMDKMALIISRVEYLCGIPGAIQAAGDALFAGLSIVGSLADVTNQADPSIVDNVSLSRLDMGAAACGQILSFPIIKDFADLPGGGLIVAPNPLYGYCKGLGAGAATSFWVKLFYTYVQLAPDEYWQLVESRRIISD